MAFYNNREVIMENWYTFKGDNFDKIVFPPFWKGIYSKMKEFAPLLE